jgi:chromosome partitioning protein
MGRVVAIVNQKGGVGKTTTAINLSYGLALSEKKVLIADLDPQSNTTRGFGYGADRDRPSIYDALSEGFPLVDTLLPTQADTLALLPAEPDLIGLEVELIGKEAKEYRLRDLFALTREDFDYVIIDCPPSLGVLTLNALVACDGVLIPVQCEYLALEGVTQLIETLRRVKATLNPGLEVLGVLLTMFDERTNLCRQVVEDIRAFFQDVTYRTVIPRNIRLGEAPSFGTPIFLYDPRSRGTEAYFNLAREFLQREEARPNMRSVQEHEKASTREGT